MMAHDVFISYSSKNKVTADAICHALEEDGIRAWIAPRDIQAGEDYGAEIIRGIRDCKVFLLVFSGDSNNSVPVQKEVERAVLGYRKTVIPFRLEDIPLSVGIEYYLGNVHWIDAYPDDSVFENLVTAVRSALGMAAKTQEPATVGQTPPTTPMRPKTVEIGGKVIETDVRTLDLSNMGLVNEDLAPLASLSWLTDLNLEQNNISDLRPLMPLIRLRRLVLQWNLIRDISPLAALTNLTHLYLVCNKIKDLSPIRSLTELSILELENNLIEDIGPLASLTDLEGLSLSNNPIQDIGPLAALVNLQWLRMYNAKATDITPLKSLKGARNLYLSDNAFSQKQIEELEAALPGCTVFF